MVDPGRHEWDRLVIGWHAVFGALAALTAALLLVGGEAGGAGRSTGLVVLTLLCGWYLATGARALHREPDRLGMAYLAGAAPLTLGLYAVNPIGAVMLFVLFPHLWALLPPRRAVAGTAPCGAPGAGGFGLAGLRQRVGQVGGSVELVTAPGAGVTLLVEIGS